MKFGENRHFMKTLLGICHAFVRTAQRSLPVLQQIKEIEFGLIGLRPNGIAMHNSLIGYVLRTSAADCLYACDSRDMCEAFRLVSCVRSLKGKRFKVSSYPTARIHRTVYGHV